MKCRCVLTKCVVCVAAIAAMALPMASPAMGATRTVNTVSVTDFGAVGDGVTDDTLAIRKALGALNPGDTLVFPANKTFAHSDTITVASDGGNWIVI